MKRKHLITYFGLSVLFIIGIIIYSCSKDENKLKKEDPIPSEILYEICPECELYAFWLPENTTIETIEGENGDEIIMTAPEGYLYYGFSSDSSLITYDDKVAPSGNSVTVTCDCTDGDDEKCGPVGNDGIVNCVIQPGCNTCERKEKVQDPTTKEEGIEILSGGFINPSLGITFAQPEDDLPYAFEAMLYYPEIKQQLDNYMLNFYSNLNEIPQVNSNDDFIIAPEGYKFVVLNVYGRALAVLLPDTKEIKEVGASGYTYSCPCNGTSGKCKHKSNIAGYHWCKKPNSNPCSEACNTMTVEDYTYTYYFFRMFIAWPLIWPSFV